MADFPLLQIGAGADIANIYEATCSLSITSSNVLINADANSTAIVDRDILDNIVADLHTGAYGTIDLGIIASGAGRGGLTAYGIFDIPLRLAGVSRAGYTIGAGRLSLPLTVTGRGISASVAPAVKTIPINWRITGSGHSGARAVGTLALVNLDITGNGHLTPHGVGSLNLNLALYSVAHIYTFDREAGTFIENFKCPVLNLSNFALTEYDFNFNSVICFNGRNFGANGTAMYELTGDSDAGVSIPWHFKTGKIDLEKNNVNRLRYVWLSYRPSGDLMLVVDDGYREYEYPVIAYDTDDNTARVKIGKGIKEKYVQFKLQNTHRQNIFLDRMRVFTESVAKKR